MSYREESENIPEVTIDPTFKRTQETLDYNPDRSERNWEAVRDECRSGGAMDERCDIIAAANGTGNLDVIAKKLGCGCVLVRADTDEVF